jgi:hypothetical protein
LRQGDVAVAAFSREEVRISHGFPSFPRRFDDCEGYLTFTRSALVRGRLLSAFGPTIACATVIAGIRPAWGEPLVHEIEHLKKEWLS